MSQWYFSALKVNMTFPAVSLVDIEQSHINDIDPIIYLKILNWYFFTTIQLTFTVKPLI